MAASPRVARPTLEVIHRVCPHAGEFGAAERAVGVCRVPDGVNMILPMVRPRSPPVPNASVL